MKNIIMTGFFAFILGLILTGALIKRTMGFYEKDYLTPQMEYMARSNALLIRKRAAYIPTSEAEAKELFAKGISEGWVNDWDEQEHSAPDFNDFMIWYNGEKVFMGKLSRHKISNVLLASWWADSIKVIEKK